MRDCRSAPSLRNTLLLLVDAARLLTRPIVSTRRSNRRRCLHDWHLRHPQSSARCATARTLLHAAARCCTLPCQNASILCDPHRRGAVVVTPRRTFIASSLSTTIRKTTNSDLARRRSLRCLGLFESICASVALRWLRHAGLRFRSIPASCKVHDRSNLSRPRAAA